MGLAVVFLVLLLFSGASHAGRRGSEFAKPYAKNHLLLILLIVAAFIAVASARGK